MAPLGKLQLMIEKINIKLGDLRLEFVEPIDKAEIERPKSIERPSDLGPLIEHTLLKPEATREAVIKLCNEAKRFQFRGVCVNPAFVELAREHLIGANYLVAATVGFPLGANLTITKAGEAEHVIRLGANEVDMVIAIGALKDGDYEKVYLDIKSVVKAAKSVPVKVILETCLLEESEKVAACLIAMRAGASYVKTSTGFARKGALVKDIKLMRKVVKDKLGIKAAGKIRKFKTAQKMVKAGATRLGCSASVAIITENIKE